jgi:hypothetical protein
VSNQLKMGMVAGVAALTITAIGAPAASAQEICPPAHPAIVAVCEAAVLTCGRYPNLCNPNPANFGKPGITTAVTKVGQAVYKTYTARQPASVNRGAQPQPGPRPAYRANTAPRPTSVTSVNRGPQPRPGPRPAARH